MSKRKTTQTHQEPIRYRAQMPAVPPPEKSETRVKEIVAYEIEDGDSGGVIKERVRKHAATPTHTTDDGDPFWPVWVRVHDDLPVHPAVVAHDAANGAVIESSSEEVQLILDRLKAEAGGVAHSEMYLTPPTVAWRHAKQQSLERLEQLIAQFDEDEPEPDGRPIRDREAAWMVPAEDVAELLGTDLEFVKRNAGKTLPAPVVVGYSWYFNSRALRSRFARR